LGRTTATEESGEVWSGALAWSGSWKLVFETTPAGRLHACGGWNDFDWAQRGQSRACWSRNS
jgi:alpha-galactosidase